jgi:hypothetical protein
VAIAFPTGNVSGSTNWNAGCSTSSTGDICGTNSDALSGIDTTKTTTNIQKDGGATACQQAGQPSHFNQACPSTIAVDTASATAWNKLFTYTTGSFAITVSVSDLAGNTATASTTITIS